MDNQPLSADDIAGFLANTFTTNHYPGTEQGGVYRPSGRPVRRLGVALEPFQSLAGWVAAYQLDALWLHRPWQLGQAALPADLGVLYHHLPFDETLTMGFNGRLSAAFGSQAKLEELGYKQAADEAGNELPARAIGMLMDVPEREFDGYLHTVKTMFGGYDRAEAGRQIDIAKIAVVGAMTDALVREAADRGANLYLTGQYRKPAQDAVDQTGMAVIAVGHRRSEEWGLRALADLLREHWPELSVTVGGV